MSEDEPRISAIVSNERMTLNLPVGCLHGFRTLWSLINPVGSKNVSKRREPLPRQIEDQRGRHPEEKILRQIFILQLFKEQLDEGFGNRPDHVEL